MMETLNIQPTGQRNTGDTKIVGFLESRWNVKNDIHKRRKVIRDSLLDWICQELGIEAFEQVGEERTNARGAGKHRTQLYTSALIPLIIDEVVKTKLFPDRIQFNTENIGGYSEQRADIAKSLTYLGNYVNNKGKYDSATLNAALDLVLGECYMYTEYEKDDNGDNVKLLRKHLKWDSIRYKYGETDVMFYDRLTVGRFIKDFGKNALKKVMYGDPFAVNQKDITQAKFNFEEQYDQNKTIGVVKYWDDAARRYYCVLGGGNYVYEKLEGDQYYWKDSDGTGRCPVRRRMMKKPLRGHFGYGLLDLLYPLARLEKVIVNSVAHSSVIASDPLTIFFADDITGLEEKWYQHLSNIGVGNHSQPVFMPQGRKNPVQTQQITHDPKIDIMEIWRKFVIDEVTFRSKVDVRVLTEFAPTAEQQRLRKQEFNQMNVKVIVDNRDEDIEYMLDAIYILMNTDSQFHSKKFGMEVGNWFYRDQSEEVKAAAKTKDGKFIPKQVTIEDFLGNEYVKELEFTMTPQLDGVLDDQTFAEIMDAERDIAIMPDIPAKQKIMRHSFTKKYPSIGFVDEDFAIITENAPEDKTGIAA